MHTFEDCNFTRPTYCEECQGLLWGLVRQGTVCKDCGLICHHDCQVKTTKCTNNEQEEEQEEIIVEGGEEEGETSSTKQSIISESPATKSLRSLQDTHITTKLKRFATSEEFQQAIVTAAVHSTDTTQPPNDYLATLPPLNPQTTTKNFTRFVSKCGLIFSSRDQLILLLSWHKPVDTMTALITYCLICLHPKLLLFIPHFILLHIIISNYTKRKQQQQDGSNTISKTYDESSPEYIRNMQNLQNIMGELSDIHDIFFSQLHHLDWSNETVTLRIFQTALVSLFGMAMIVWFIPLNIVCMVAGIILFLLNTRFAKYLVKEMLPQATELGQQQLKSAADWYHQVENRLDEQLNLKYMSLYENQRWWAGSAFIPHMLPGERGIWSDYSGMTELSQKEELSAPKGYRWTEDNWKLDEKGPWIDDHLGIEIIVTPENGGWVYTDDNWKNPRDNSNIKSTTRRRRWVRQCERILNESSS
ncbi:hypothetical protein K501DRAFT_246386 [Backusella circina FSU 941]|nr:hypothetical protein K501DRAFT_246386 [Backusella circina FSU 941]